MRGCVDTENKKVHKQGQCPYIHMRVRFRIIFKYTEIVCRKPHGVSATVHTDSQLK